MFTAKLTSRIPAIRATVIIAHAMKNQVLLPNAAALALVLNGFVSKLKMSANMPNEIQNASNPVKNPSAPFFVVKSTTPAIFRYRTYNGRA